MNSILFVLFIVLSILLWFDLPDSYPARFDLAGNPVAWQDKNPAAWILLVFFGAFSFGKIHLFQRYLINDPDSDLLNVPKKKLFRQLPRDQKLFVLKRVNRMTGILNSMVLATFMAILLATWASAHHEVITLPWGVSMVMVIAATLFYTVYEAIMLNRVISRKLRSEGLLD